MLQRSTDMLNGRPVPLESDTCITSPRPPHLPTTPAQPKKRKKGTQNHVYQCSYVVQNYALLSVTWLVLLNFSRISHCFCISTCKCDICIDSHLLMYSPTVQKRLIYFKEAGSSSCTVKSVSRSSIIFIDHITVLQNWNLCQIHPFSLKLCQKLVFPDANLHASSRKLLPSIASAL